MPKNPQREQNRTDYEDRNKQSVPTGVTSVSSVESEPAYSTSASASSSRSSTSAKNPKDRQTSYESNLNRLGNAEVTTTIPESSAKVEINIGDEEFEELLNTAKDKAKQDSEEAQKKAESEFSGLYESAKHKLDHTKLSKVLPDYCEFLLKHGNSAKLEEILKNSGVLNQNYEELDLNILKIVGKYYRICSMYDESAKRFQRYLEKSSEINQGDSNQEEIINVYINLISVCSVLGYDISTLEHYKIKALELNVDAKSKSRLYANLSFIKYKRGLYEDGIAEAEAGERQNPEVPSNHFNKALCLLRRNSEDIEDKLKARKLLKSIQDDQNNRWVSVNDEDFRGINQIILKLIDKCNNEQKYKLEDLCMILFSFRAIARLEEFSKDMIKYSKKLKDSIQKLPQIKQELLKDIESGERLLQDKLLLGVLMDNPNLIEEAYENRDYEQFVEYNPFSKAKEINSERALRELEITKPVSDKEIEWKEEHEGNKLDNNGQDSKNETVRELRHRRGKQNAEEKQSEDITKKEVEKDQSGAPMKLQKIDDSWLRWMVSNLASGAKNVYSYFANWFYWESYELEINQNNKSSFYSLEEYGKPWAHEEFSYPGQRVFNKVLEIRKLMQETDEYNEQNKNKYISKLQEVLDESMPKQQPSKQNYLVKIIFVTLELEAIYGDAGKAAEEYLKTLNEEQKTKLYEASIFKSSIKKYAAFNFEYEFRDYLKRNGIEKEEADQETLNKYAVKWQKDNAEINYRLLEMNDNQKYFEKFKWLNELWEFDEEEGTVEFKGDLQELEEWKEFTENISCIGNPTGVIDDNLN